MGKTDAEASATSVGKRRAKFEDYDGFVAKFAKPAKMTTDECYTPPEIYDVVRDWCVREYKLDGAKIVRPFYPGGDYENFDYSGGAVVIDNPPFSRLAEIVRFYLEREIPFFLFANGLTALSSRASFGRACRIITDTDLVYANGAKVNTSFITSFEPGVVARTAPELTRLLVAKVAELRGSASRPQRRYEFPREVLRATDIMNLARRGVDFRVPADECVGACRLDDLSRRSRNGGGVFGGCLLVSARVADEFAAAKRVADEFAVAKRVTEASVGDVVRLSLSERERAIVASLARGKN